MENTQGLGPNQKNDASSLRLHLHHFFLLPTLRPAHPILRRLAQLHSFYQFDLGTPKPNKPSTSYSSPSSSFSSSGSNAGKTAAIILGGVA
ncbi:hypothetical protein LXL04_027288 [Taraxacum kok-saghyz]